MNTDRCLPRETERLEARVHITAGATVPAPSTGRALRKFNGPRYDVPMHGDDLLQRVAQGDNRAFGELVSQYQDFVFRVARRIVAEDGARDVCVDVMLRVREYAAKIEPGSIKSWLYTTTIRECFHRLRKERRYRNFGPTDEDRDLDGSASDEPSAEDLLVRSKEVRSIRHALPALSEEHREVLVLYYFEDMALKEIGDTLGVPEGTVRSRKHYALEHLRMLLHADDTSTNTVKVRK